MTITRVSHITVYVPSQPEALAWYRDRLGFQVCMDNNDMEPSRRWLTVSPVGNFSTQFVLALAGNDEERARIGTNPMTVLQTDECRSEIARLHEAGVEIVEAPVTLPWGLSAIIRDPYGNPYNLVGPG